MNTEKQNTVKQPAMLQCNINLAKGLIWSRTKRLLFYRLLMVYLFAVLLALLALGSSSVRRVRDAVRLFNESMELERKFAASHTGEAGLQKYIDQLKTKLEQTTVRIDAINRALPPAIHTPLPALVLLVNHSGKASLHRFTFSEQTEKDPAKLQFDLMTPLDAARTAASTRAFQDIWQNDPGLSARFPEIKQLQVRRSELVSGPVLITQYEATGKD
jgi:hypothetical protein